MKKLVTCLFVAGIAMAALSCKSTAAAGDDFTPPVIEGEVTQDKVNQTLTEIYDNYRGKLDLSGAQTYTVVANDTLSGIARKFYGSLTGIGNAGPSNGFYFPVIMIASDTTIVDPDLIEPGTRLLIPDLQKNLDNPDSRAAIKEGLEDVAYVYNRKGVAATENGLKNLANSL
jgi:nucleoid-associated protein YgaU